MKIEKKNRFQSIELLIEVRLSHMYVQCFRLKIMHDTFDLNSDSQRIANAEMKQRMKYRFIHRV